MPFAFSIHPDENLIRTKCTGDFTTEELLAHTGRVNAHPDFRPGMNTLGDFRGTRWLSDVASMASFVDHAKELEKIRGTCKWALIADDESFRLFVEMFNLVSHRYGVTIETRAFESEEEAMAWLHDGS